MSKPKKMYLREWRVVRGYTQSRLAKKLGTYAPSISKWEHGFVIPRQNNIDRIVRILKLGTEERLYENPFAEVE